MTVETLGEAYALGWRVHMRCADDRRDGMKRRRECGFRYELDMATLVCIRGRAFPLARLAERLRCPHCGSRHVAVLFDPPAQPRRAMAAG